MSETTRTQVWSCGGGTQSAAIAALIVQGRLPKPDLAVMVDTEREKSGTWEYAESVLIPELARVGVTLEIVRKSAFERADLWGGPERDSLLIPAFTVISGTVGKMPNFCSGYWKKEVVDRWLRSRGVTACDTWIGISLDEMRRVRQSRTAWNQNRYPLIFDFRMRRNECERLVMDGMGWPKPPRSACYHCPNQSDAEWREMLRDHPGDFAKAVALEREIRERDPHAFLHQSGVPLDQVDFSVRETGQASLFEDAGCHSGMCFV